MSNPLRIIAIDLGTSRVKVGLVDETLTTIATSSHTYPTLTVEPGMAEQRPQDWLNGIRASVSAIFAAVPAQRIDAIVLTAQMPTLVTLDATGASIGNAITWQDSRADAFVEDMLDHGARRRVHEIAGTPIDGRYIIPMHLRRGAAPPHATATLLSAKDFLYFALTSELVTDPSTASGYGNFDLAARGWSDELNELWGIDAKLLPRIVDSHRSAALNDAGAALLPGVPPGTPVVVGAADSVCAHHFITTLFEGSLSVIDGSSTVIMATVHDGATLGGEVLVTPLVDALQRGAEMDLLATGSSIAWLAQLLALTPAQLEDLALSNPRRVENETMFLPYLAGGEQGVIWRSDISGSIDGLSLSTSREDLALALFEGIAIETVRCIELLERSQRIERVVSVAGPQSRHLGASLLGSLLEVPVLALAQQSPSLLGAALVAIEQLGGEEMVENFNASSILGSLPLLEPEYHGALAHKAGRYRAVAAQSGEPLNTRRGDE